MPTLSGLLRRVENGKPPSAGGVLEGFCSGLGNLNELASSPSRRLMRRFCVLLRMTLDTLKHRDVTKINRMLERLIRFMAILAFVVSERAQINRVLKWSGLNILLRRRRRVIDHCVADVAVIANDFAGVADVLAIVAAEAAGGIKMADVVWMSLPISLHLWKEVSLKDSLNFRDGAFDRARVLRVHIFVVRLIELTQVFINRTQSLRRRFV